MKGDAIKAMLFLFPSFLVIFNSSQVLSATFCVGTEPELNTALTKAETNGEDGNDTLWGKDGYDILSGGNGVDYLYGSTSNDKLYGGNHPDALVGGPGVDELYGGAGKYDNDSCHDISGTLFNGCNVIFQSATE